MYFFTENFIPGQSVQALPPPSLQPGISEEQPAEAAVAIGGGSAFLNSRIVSGAVAGNAVSGAIGFFTGTLRVPVRWYFAKPDAEYMPFPTCFGSSIWDAEYEACDGMPGEDRWEGHKWSNGRTPTTATGRGHFCGTEEQWQNGFAYGTFLNVRYDDQGIPLCCRSQRGAAAIGYIGLGGPSTPSRFSYVVSGLQSAIFEFQIASALVASSPAFFMSSLSLAGGALGLASVSASGGSVCFGSLPFPDSMFGLGGAFPAQAFLAIAGPTPCRGEFEWVGITPASGSFGDVNLVPADTFFLTCATAIAEERIVTGTPCPAMGAMRFGHPVPSPASIAFSD